MAGWSGEVAARPNEQPIKGRVRPFRESPGRKKTLGRRCTWLRQRRARGGGEDSFRERGTFHRTSRGDSTFSSFEFAKERRELVRGPEFPGLDGIYIFKFPPSAELCHSNEIFKKFAVVVPCTRAVTLETSKLVIDFSFT